PPPPRPPPPAPPPPPPDYGAPLLQALQAGEPTPVVGDAHALVQALARIALAVQGADPARLRRQESWWGRLLGRDVTRQAQAQALQSQLGVLVLQAREQAQRLQGHLQQRQAAIAHAQTAAQALQHWADAAQPLLATLPAHAQAGLAARVDHLQRLSALRALDAGQWQLLNEQDQALLQRFAHIHDTLLPAWRQAALAGQAQARAAQAAQAADLQAQIDHEVAAAQARLR
ncbi:hypothetical protein, partial [Stenotrophomonas sp. S48]|uniref:hypothetical protein n=1 Tax=Stenotrophomonas sp. S48 TaxID=2767465 RepID=UPI001F2D94D8